MDCSMPGFPVLHYSQSLLKFMSIESIMLSNHFILCFCLLLLLSVFPNIRIFSNELTLHIRWSKCWSFSLSPSNEYSELIPLALTGLFSLLSKGLTRVLSSTTVGKNQFFGTHPSLWSNLTSVHDYWKSRSFPSKEQVSFNFMAAVSICSDFGGLGLLRYEEWPMMQSLSDNCICELHRKK